MLRQTSLVLVLLFVSGTFACSCLEQPYKISFCRAPYALKGTIIDVDKESQSSDESSIFGFLTPRTVYYEVRIDGIFKGEDGSYAIGDIITFTTSSMGSLCGIPGLVQGTYYFEVYDEEIGMCDRIIRYSRLPKVQREWYEGGSLQCEDRSEPEKTYSSSWK